MCGLFVVRVGCLLYVWDVCCTCGLSVVRVGCLCGLSVVCVSCLFYTIPMHEPQEKLTFDPVA